MALKFIALSGTTGVNENLYIYEANNQMMIVDCGLGFPDSDMLGVDVVIPDFSYIIKNKDKLKGVLVSHGHEDHMGALPFLLRELQAPIYSTKLVSAFIENKLVDYGIKKFDLRVFDPDKDEPVKIGPFSVHPFRLAHSVPDTVGFAIDTPEGRVMHAAEYKFEQHPIDGFKIDEAKIKRLAEGGVLALASDCLGSNKAGFTPSERDIGPRLEKIIKSASKAIYFTTISSNISRMQQAINLAEKYGRFVVFVGRTIETKATIANSLGYLKYNQETIINFRQARKKQSKNIMYITAGSYGQPGSALYRIASGEHSYLHVDGGDTVIFSSDPAPPGAKEAVDFMVDKLLDIGADVHYYDLNEKLHVSGHGESEDIKKMLSLVKAKYLIPVGGTIRFMKAFENLVTTNKINKADNIFELKTGEIVEFSKSQAKRAGRLDVKEVLVDGLGIGDVGRVVLQDRKILSEGGIAVAVVLIDAQTRQLAQTPEIMTRGFVFERENRQLINRATKKLAKTLKERGELSRKSVKEVVISQLERYFATRTGRRPMIVPVVIEV